MSKPLTPAVAILVTIVLSACAQIPHTCSQEEATAVVEQFGERLKLVSVWSPAAEEDLRSQYADLVSPALLDQWAVALPEAPGRKASSPWPERIEVTTVEEIASGRFSVSAKIIEMTSWEVTHGGVANEIPVTLTVDTIEGRCLITQYEESAPDE